MGATGNGARSRRVSVAAGIRLVLIVMAVPPLAALVVTLGTEGSVIRAVDQLDWITDTRLDLAQLRSFTDAQQAAVRNNQSGRGALPADYVAARSAAQGIADDLADDAASDPTLDALMHPATRALTTWVKLLEEDTTEDDVGPDPTTQIEEAFHAVGTTLDALEIQVEVEVQEARDGIERYTAQGRLILRFAIGVTLAATVIGAAILIRWLRAPLARFEADLVVATTDPDASLSRDRPAEFAAMAERVDAVRATAREESRRQLQRDLVLAQEDERRTIASDLHDEVIQSLTAAGLRLQLAATDAPPSMLPILDAVADATADAIERLRDLVFELLPPSLEPAGFVSALDAFGTARSEGTGIGFSATGDAGRASAATQTMAYRVARELVSNAFQHAQADHIAASVAMTGGDLEVVVQDDGIGFATSGRSHRPGHIGLQSCEDLVRGCDGAWSVSSTLGGGTQVAFSFPDGAP